MQILRQRVIPKFSILYENQIGDAGVIKNSLRIYPQGWGQATDDAPSSTSGQGDVKGRLQKELLIA